MNIPNILTLFRLLCVVLLVIAFYLPFGQKYTLCALIFAVASITDWFDGYLARRLNQVTEFGAFFDPVVDKIFVTVALCLLIEKYRSFWVTMPSIIIIGREIVISALREWMAELGQRTSVAVNLMGKLKTAVQMLAVTILLQAPVINFTILDYWGGGFLYFSATLTLWSMYLYLRSSWSYLSPFKKKEKM